MDLTRALPLGASLAVVALVVPVTLLAKHGSGSGVPQRSSPSSAVDASPASGWTRIQHEGVSVDLPPGCRPESNLSFYGSALFDPRYGPGIRGDEKHHTWGGYVYAGDQVVWISSDDRQTVERVLDSVEP